MIKETISFLLVACLEVYAFLSVLYLIRQILFLIFVYSQKKSSSYENIDIGSYGPSVSVVIPAHNEEKTIEKCLESIFSLDYPEDRLTVMVINDLSTDRTLQILERIKEKHKKLVIHNRGIDSKRGKPSALKESMPLIHSELIVLFDADYLPAPSLLKKLIIPFVDPKVGATMGRVVPHNTNVNLLTRVIDLERRAGYVVDQTARALWGLSPQFGGTVGGIRYAALKDVGGWNERSLTEDTDLTYRLLLKGWNIEYLNYASCYEESPQTWKSRFKQLKRWSYGHNECMFRYIIPLLKSKKLPFIRKIDALCVLCSFFYCAFSFPCIPLAILVQTFYADYGIVLSFIPIISYFTGLSYFSMYWQVIVAILKDDQPEAFMWVPFLPFSGVLNGLAIFSGFFQLLKDKWKKSSFEWEKTARYTEWNT